MADFRIAPFSIYSSSVETGYISEISASFRPHIDLTNMHEDRYGNYSDAPMQGPFTYKYVGGNQQRHIPLNEGTDTPLTRPELFDIYMTGGVLEVRGPDTAGGVDRPRAPYFREPMAKRPLNIENIQMRTGSAIIGNYSNDYEFIQTVGRTSNNRAFVEANGVGFIGDPTEWVRAENQVNAGYAMGGYQIRLSGMRADGENGGGGNPTKLWFAATETSGLEEISIQCSGTYVKDTWYRVRADIIPVGSAGDSINIYTSSAGDVPSGQETWELVANRFISATADPLAYKDPTDSSLRMGWYNHAEQSAAAVSYIDQFEILVEDL